MPKIKRVPKRQSYVQQDVNNAIEAIKNGMSLGRASVQFGVPKSTLYSKNRELVPIEAKMGPSTYLSKGEEGKIVDWIMFLTERGFPVTKNLLLDRVRQLIVQLERKTPFTNDRPGRHWFESFIRRHPKLTNRITHSRASLAGKQIHMWFNEVSQQLSELNLWGINHSRIFHCTECQFFLSQKWNQGVKKAPKGTILGSDKDFLTALFTVNASGSLVNPMITFPYKRIPTFIAAKMPADWQIGLSELGWMNSESFFDYISNHFYPWLLRNNIELPVVLYIDVHSPFLSLSVVEFCRKMSIELISLYPTVSNSTPLGVAIFDPIKSAFSEIFDNWQQESGSERLRREDFAQLLQATLQSMNLQEMIQTGFKNCGLAPFSKDAAESFGLNKVKKNIDEESRPATPIPIFNKQQMEFQAHLEFMERHLDFDVLEKFKEAYRSGVDDIKVHYKGLFLYWLKIKHLSGA